MGHWAQESSQYPITNKQINANKEIPFFCLFRMKETVLMMTDRQLVS